LRQRSVSGKKIWVIQRLRSHESRQILRLSSVKKNGGKKLLRKYFPGDTREVK